MIKSTCAFVYQLKWWIWSRAWPRSLVRTVPVTPTTPGAACLRSTPSAPSSRSPAMITVCCRSACSTRGIGLTNNNKQSLGWKSFLCQMSCCTCDELLCLISIQSLLYLATVAFILQSLFIPLTVSLHAQNRWSDDPTSDSGVTCSFLFLFAAGLQLPYGSNQSTDPEQGFK